MSLNLQPIEYSATSDHTMQPAMLLRAADSAPRPLLVILHTWSADWKQNMNPYFEQAAARDWHAIAPNFRGPNRHPDACGSVKAMQDIIDAVTFAKGSLAVDADRVYLVGGSGGGHMTLQTASHHSRHFAAASAWCPITDLSAWHREHVKEGQPDGYARNIEASVGGKPGDSEQVDRELRARSPLFHITGTAKLPLDINHGVHDGKRGSVPFRHSVDAFNALAEYHGTAKVTDEEIRQLDQLGKLQNPTPADIAEDASYGRTIHLRRHAGPARLTIFEGGHDALAGAAGQWLAQHSRSGKPTSDPVRTAAPAAGVTAIGR